MNKKHGFTLIEMSMVIAAIGLIIGGVLVGRTLIEQAQLRSIVSENEKYQGAINSFKGKYDCLPGDCRRATELFGLADGTGSITHNVCRDWAELQRGTTGTCYGNGDGQIGKSGAWGVANDGLAADAIGYERYAMWQHLSLAKLVPGNFTIKGAGVSSGHKAGDNTAPSKAYSEGLWTITFSHNFADAQQTLVSGYAAVGKHVLVFGGQKLIATAWQPPQPILRLDEAATLDSKYDDGKPLQGKITANIALSGSDELGYTGDECAVASTPLDESADYTVSGQSKKKPCLLYFTVD